jgi:polysaccharide biosynthesis protein PslH
MRTADVLIHLNNEEAEAFQKLLPAQRHALLYPAVAPAPAGPGGPDLIIVASANYANYLGLVWFLTEVLPLAPAAPVQIIGNVDREVRARAPRLWKKHAALFRGRVEDLDAAYANAAAILLPTTQGHGVSIKTLEAMSSGAPLIATAHAFRGLGIEPAAFRNVTLAKDAAGFAAALARAVAGRHSPPGDRLMADTRLAYQKLFSFEAYHAALLQLVEPLLDHPH